MGCWQLAGGYSVQGKPAGWGEMPPSEGVRLVRHAWGKGIRFYDTAAGYGNGRSEQILGEALGEEPDAMICTKAVLDPTSSHFKQNVEYAINGSLRRLRREHIEVFLLHGPADQTHWSEVDTTPLERAKILGKIGAWGVSSRSIVGARQALQYPQAGTWVEWILNPLERRPETQLFPHLGKNHFIARSPLARGFLSRHHLRNPTTFTDFRSTLPKDWQQWTRGHAARLAELTGDNDLASLSLRYAIGLDSVSFVIPGLRSKLQIDTACAAVERGPLSHKTRAKIESLPSFYPPWA